MSIQPIGSAVLEEGPAGPAAATQRMEHLQAMIASIEAGPASFAAQLSAAQTEASSSTTDAASASSPTDDVLPTTAGTLPTATGALPTAAGALPTSTSALPTATGALPTTAGTLSTSTGALPTVGIPTYASYSPSAAWSAAGDSGYDALIEQAAARNGVDPAVLHGLIQQESGFDPNATSSAGAVGLTQLMPGTAASLGLSDPSDPAQSIEGGARYLGEMMREFGGNTEDALAAYNAGPGAVHSYGGVPPYTETQQYVTKVLDYAAEYRDTHGAAQSVASGRVVAPAGQVSVPVQNYPEAAIA